MIQVIPAMSIMDGKVVKLTQKTEETLKIYDKNPLDLAMEFEDAGFTHLHLVDLDGAKSRKVVNYKTLELLAKYTKLEINFTGGVSSDGDVRTVFEFGAKSMTAASVALHEPEKFKSWLISYGRNKIMLAADTLDGIVRTGGWRQSSDRELFEYIEYYQERGIQFVKSTEISRDGSQQGANLELYKKLVATFPEIKFLASGGIRNIQDIKDLDAIGIYSALIGTSFYEGTLTLEELKPFAS